jgi:hypothetical protein
MSMTIDEIWNQFCERMTYQGQPHVVAEAREFMSEDIARLNERNLHVLRTLASLDEKKPENKGEMDDPLVQELQRMDSKINVLLDIVDRLLMPETLLPARQSVRFNAVGIVVRETVIPASETLCIRMHFDACRALPLELLARFGRSTNDGNAFVYFCEVSELVEDGLERFVFCHHRRRVAEARLIGAAENVPPPKQRM